MIFYQDLSGMDTKAIDENILFSLNRSKEKTQNVRKHLQTLYLIESFVHREISHLEQ